MSCETRGIVSGPDISGAYDSDAILGISNEGGGSCWVAVNGVNTEGQPEAGSIQFFEDGHSRQTWQALIELKKVLGTVRQEAPSLQTRLTELAAKAFPVKRQATRQPDYERKGFLRVVEEANGSYVLTVGQSRHGRPPGMGANFRFGASHFKANAGLQAVLSRLLDAMEIDSV